MLSDVSKITFFEDKLSIKAVSFCVQIQPRHQIKFLLTSWIHWRSQNFQASYDWKVHFRDKPIAPFCMPFWFTYFWGSILESEHIPRLVLTSRIWFELKSLFWLTCKKFNILDDFVLWVGISNSIILDLLRISMLFFLNFGFIEKRDVKIWFLK